MQKIIIHTDGGARGNPGPAGIGVVIEDESGEVLKEISEFIGEATNNIAEYHALIRALGEAKVLFGERTLELPFEVMMDSELVVRQMQGVYKVKEPALKEKFAMVALMRMEDFPNITFTHVRREKNTRADELVNESIDRALKKYEKL